MQDFISKLNWRYATKKFDPQKKLSQEQLDMLLESLRLAPSSFGLQPWKFVVVEDSGVRKNLREKAWNQPQVTDSSHLIVLCNLREMTKDHVKKYVADIAKTRSVPAESIKDYEDMMLNFVDSLTPEAAKAWMKHQVYLALGTLLVACAVNDIDACPMEGFDPGEFDRILELDKNGIESAVLCAVGFRAGDDEFGKLDKVRFPKDEVIVRP